MNSSVHLNNKERYILLPGDGPAQGLDDTTLIAEKSYPINFIEPRNKFCLSLHCNGVNSSLFVNGVEVHIMQKILKLMQVLSVKCLL